MAKKWSCERREDGARHEASGPAGFLLAQSSRSTQITRQNCLDKRRRGDLAK
ncbi:MAG: hypothetical protein P0S96_03380 [Simkaniaceae bacterium]|nr:hypothetical protein [Candidatus Sacchlamyda saccharinae]